ncbi:MAG: hypothetical protein AMJ84_10335 [Acidithiobacillales bacterium SM23_46]|jgi:serine/threonine protein kinase|nr:MAG: hypothetical protein AMJ84_10335 [Acidithiobacillales bacterium SM23_46]
MSATHRQTLHEVRTGETIDGFVVGKLLHEGGMARLYKATRRGIHTPMLMKVPKTGAGAPAAALPALENELRVLQRLHGPHVPKLFGHGDLRATPYIVMEYIEGDRLAQAVARAPLPIAELANLGAALCKAVHVMHHQNVIHLDLNPRNVRTRADGTMVLIDFGIAHHASLPDLIDAAFGEAAGTAAYVAPEQVRELRSESRSDIYAIGVILYLLATGRFPFGRANLLSVKRRLFEPPLPPRLHRPDLPPWLQEVILRCLEIRPEHRFTTAKQIVHALTHPDSVHLTARAHRVRPVDWLTRLRLWWRSLYEVFDEAEPVRPFERLSHAPHVLLALDLPHTSEPLKQALRVTVRKFARNEPHSYFTCLSVMRPADRLSLRPDEPSASAAERIAEMRTWAQPLHLPPGRISFHVAEGSAADVISDYAHHHVLDYIIVGAQGRSPMGRILGSVSARVVAEAPCSVTVVRPRELPKAREEHPPVTKRD